MKKSLLLCLALLGAVLANISAAGPDLNALHSVENTSQLELTVRETQNSSVAVSKHLIKSVQCQIAENESYSRCRSTCSTTGIANYTPGVCGVGAKCSCVATVENPPGG